MGDRWFVGSVQPGLSDTAKLQLSRQSINSCHLRVKDRDGRPVSYFPGYIFVQLQVEWLRELASMVNNTRGIGRLLPAHLENPLTLPVGFVERLQEAADTGKLDEQIEMETQRFGIGETVQVQSGAWMGTRFQVTRYRKGALVFLASLLGKDFEVEVPQHQVEKAPDAGRITTTKAIHCPQYRPRLRGGAVATAA